LPHLREIDFGVVEVVLRILADEGAIGISELAAELCGNPGPECARRHDGVFREDSSGGNDRPLTDAAVVEDCDAHPDEHIILDNAAVDCGVMADRDPVADGHRVEVALAMQDGTVLDVGVCPHADGVDVAAKDGVHPNRGVLAEFDIPENLGRDVDIAGFGYAGHLSLVTADHGDRKNLCNECTRADCERCLPGVRNALSIEWVETSEMP